MDGLFTGLADGEHDIVAAALATTAERKKTLAFSEPHFQAGS
ncbi:transporter substrate-binding domain-containing protein [Chitiniphilus purpureus]|uniref:Transporter substrate-binding domain-containing protein n=1 Tax=Chitiniphilus purpureus TaxID=2981137 RepID=A0ABY6DIJ4_9NEIS|nr:transporter substrate-binding domain-containing protein [Chitiniphilus sp. CD1]UXY14058.1 transporter substrate-binding domain-containing protein [Chitiniphilus sp. CD1]